MGVGAPQTRLSAIETGGACETFDDSFLRDWIGERLGGSEVRLVAVCVVRVGRCGESDAACAERSRISTILASVNAVILEKAAARFVAAWGLTGLGAEDVCASIAAVERVVGENSPNADVVAAIDICELTVDSRASDIEPEDLGARIGDKCHHLDEAVARAADGKPRLLVTSRFAGACLYGQELPAVANEPLVRRRAEATRPIWLEIPLDDRRNRPSVRLSGRLAAQSGLDELGDLKPLARAAASAGASFSANALGEMLAISAGRLVGGLEALLRRDVLAIVPEADRSKRRQRTRAGSQRSGLPIKADTLLRFVSDAVQCAAYQSVAELKRRQFHAHAAAIRVPQGRQSPAVEPEAIARHYRAASNMRQSKRWFSKAAWQAIAQGDYADAVDYLRSALDECQDEAFSPAFERSLLQLLGVQLAIVEGNGSDAVFDAYLRSIDAADTDQPVPYGQEFRSLWLAQSCHLVKGDIRGALTAGKHLELRLKRDMAGATRRSLGMRLLVKRLNGLTLMLAGNIAGARHDYTCVLADYDPDRHAVLRLSYGSDQRCLALAHLAWLSAYAHRPESARVARENARAACEALNHSHTSAHSLSVLALAALEVGEASQAMLLAHEARSLATTHEFAYWIAWNDAILACAQIGDSPRQSFVALAEAADLYRSTGAGQLLPMIHAWRSSAAINFGDFDCALDEANTGLDLVRQSGALLFEPQLFRVRALSRLAAGQQKAAATDLSAAYAAATKMGASAQAYRIAREAAAILSGAEQVRWQAVFHQLLMVRV